MWFELTLVKKGLLSVDQLLSAVRQQRLGRVPLGRLAIQEAKMKMGQVFQVLKVQADDPRSFGQLAIELGFLAVEELDELLQLQNRMERPLADILIGQGVIDEDVFESEKKKFQQQLTREFETYICEEAAC